MAELKIALNFRGDPTFPQKKKIKIKIARLHPTPPLPDFATTGRTPYQPPSIRVRFSLLPSSFHLLPAFQAPTSVVLSGVDLWQTLASIGYYLSTAAVIATEPSLIFHGAPPLPLRCLDLAQLRRHLPPASPVQPTHAAPAFARPSPHQQFLLYSEFC
jgi:hypothetical protein